VAGTVSGIVGTGSSIMLMPVLIYSFGPKEAVPIMAVAAVIANASRVIAWAREVEWKPVLAYAVGGIPGAALGAMTLLSLPSRLIDVAIGLFFLAMIPARRRFATLQFSVNGLFLAVAGFVIGFLTGIVVSTGPLSLPVFFAYGLTKGAFLGTEAAASLAVYGTKAIVFGGFGALPWDIVAKGLATGASVMAGTFVAKHVVVRLQAESFRLLMEAVMLVSGLILLWTAFTDQP